VRFIIKEGTDIRTVTKSSRDLARRPPLALAARDRPVCVGCGKRLGLQADHCFVDYAKDGPTESTTWPCCAPHHDMKTYGGWTLIRTKEGTWLWQAPKNPPSAGAIARAKKLAVAQAKAASSTTCPGGERRTTSEPR
jgi:hypothetical protein